MPDNSQQPRPDALTEQQQGRIKQRGTDQDRTLLASGLRACRRT